MNGKSTNSEIRNAIKIGDINKVKQLISNDTKIIHRKTSYGTWLHIAAKKGDLNIVKFLVHKGIEVDASGGTFDSSALNLAAGAGHLDVVNYLIEAGAELDVSLAKRNPLFGAIYGGHKNVVEFLVEKGIDVSIRYTGESLKNMNAYEYAIVFGQTEIAEYLIR
ncbi:ankyrin repeat domain-containing protein [Bacillus cereus]|uniref:ankyrin repeat domain-containing protein n=1 Tax=Bacillus cereus TaxID=1396 RepID=UPI003D16C4AB